MERIATAMLALAMRRKPAAREARVGDKERGSGGDKRGVWIAECGVADDCKLAIANCKFPDVVSCCAVSSRRFFAASMSSVNGKWSGRMRPRRRLQSVMVSGP